MESAEIRYNCLELAHRIKPGTGDITQEAQKFLAFVEGEDARKRGDASLVLIDRQLAEQIASERSDVMYDTGNDSYRRRPEAEEDRGRRVA